MTQAVSSTIYLDRTDQPVDESTTAAATNAALVDNVVDVQISYFGDPNPPLKPKPAPGDANCLYDSTGNYIGPGVLPTVDGSLAALTPAMLTNGPFCGGGSNQFDPDLAARAQGAHDGPTPGGECSVARHGPDALA